jgi:hypothetical protein
LTFFLLGVAQHWRLASGAWTITPQPEADADFWLATADQGGTILCGPFLFNQARSQWGSSSVS